MSEINPALSTLRSAEKIGFVFGGGSARCAFQIGAIETLRELGIRPALCVGVSGGVWNAAAVAAGTDHRLRHYWKCFVRYPYLDLGNILSWDRSPFIWRTLHERTFEKYIGSDHLRRNGLPLFISLTRLRDRASVILDARSQADPFRMLLAANYLPPFYSRTPRIDGERYGDGGVTNNLPYEVAFEQGCDAVVLVALKGESEGGPYRNIDDIDHEIPATYRDRVVVIRPRHRVPVPFLERRWSVLAHLADVGRLRAREVLLGERHPETEWAARGEALTLRLARLTGRTRRPPLLPSS